MAFKSMVSSDFLPKRDQKCFLGAPADVQANSIVGPMLLLPRASLSPSSDLGGAGRQERYKEKAATGDRLLRDSSFALRGNLS